MFDCHFNFVSAMANKSKLLAISFVKGKFRITVGKNANFQIIRNQSAVIKKKNSFGKLCDIRCRIMLIFTLDSVFVDAHMQSIDLTCLSVFE